MTWVDNKVKADKSPGSMMHFQYMMVGNALIIIGGYNKEKFKIVSDVWAYYIDVEEFEQLENLEEPR